MINSSRGMAVTVGLFCGEISLDDDCHVFSICFKPAHRVTISEIPQKTCERLRYIEFRVLFLGEVCRPDIAHRFGVKAATCSRDIALYQELAPQNLRYELSRRRYVSTPEIKPLFDHDSIDALRFLHSSQFTITIGDPKHRKVATFSVPSRPLEWEKIYRVTQALQSAANGKQEVIYIDYVSDSGGQKGREIIPHAVFTFGGFWYLRAYDRDSSDFRNFKFNRILKSACIDTSYLKEETARYDSAWNSIEEITLVAHPQKEHKEAIQEDYDIPEKGKKFEVPQALLGFLLTDWRVDCSPEATLNHLEYPLRLIKPEDFNHIGSFEIAPGVSRKD